MEMPFFIPEWAIQDIVIFILTVAVAGFILKKEEKPGRILLELLCFTFLYAAVYENFATLMGWYGYGQSFLMIGKVPLSVPVVEYLVVYASLRLSGRMRLPGWAKPLFTGFNAMVFDFSLDPIAVKLFRDLPSGRIARWSWFPGASDAQIMSEPVYNFTGWVLLAGYAAVFILLGRAWWERSGRKTSVAVAYPVLGMIAALLVMVSPLSRFLLWLWPFFQRGSVAEWIMLAFHVASGLSVILLVWRGRMKSRVVFKEEWPAYAVLGGLHAMDILMCFLSGNYPALVLVLPAAFAQWGLLLWISRSRADEA
jgi:hypothetical protein